MNIRYKLLRDILKRDSSVVLAKRGNFAHLTFHQAVIEKMLPKNICANIQDAKEGKAKLNPQFIGAIAQAMQQWAIGHGATHYCHWFQPWTGFAAEKQDAFLDWNSHYEVIEKFSAKQLMRGETDASSFPSGGLRTTFEARGYTMWDPSSTPFLWEMGGTRVFCLPSLFFSWTGKALDMKIPLMRSEAKLNNAAMRLLNLLDIKAKSVHATLGCEQEYFLIDRAFFLARPDLIMTGRTLFGAAASKGQELEDHYFSILKERVAAFMTDLEHRAWALGIPLKTRHSEVAPNQFEAAPLFERISIGTDHNILLMELMRQVAIHHHLACLLHEKPFAGINGSGKHCNWSLMTDTGKNLLDPYAFPDHHMPFLILLTAVLHAVYTHGALLRASIGTPGNDHRLGGHEAPPPILSVDLGHSLEKWLDHLEKKGAHLDGQPSALDLAIPSVPEMVLDDSDRNRTSPFPFTGTKFEFRAVGSSQHPALPLTVLNAIVADSLNQIVDKIEKEAIKSKKPLNAALNVVRSFLKQTKPIRFSGNNYSPQWVKEAKRRKLPNIAKSVNALEEFLKSPSVKAFEGILSKKEIEARVDAMKERYCKIIDIEARLLQDSFQTQILTAAIQWQKKLAESIEHLPAGSKCKHMKMLLKNLTDQIEITIKNNEELEKARCSALSQNLNRKTAAFSQHIAPKCEMLRAEIDALELLIEDRLWPLPKYREMLHIL